MILVASLILLTLGAWAMTVYQARTMDMPMGVAVRGEATLPEPAPAQDAMAGMPGMASDDAETRVVHAMAGASMGGMSAMGWGWEAVLTFIVAWTVMMAAMMFPSIAPMLVLFQAMTSRRMKGGSAMMPTWVFASGYLAVWTMIGIATWILVRLASDAAGRMSLARRETWAPLALGAVLVVAGLYQFTPLKGACLRQCQSPIGFLMTHWRDGISGALRMGVVHGAYCLGCCWALFAVLIATGVMSLAWMLLLTLVVFAEKMNLLGVHAPRIIGAVLLGFGILVATGASSVPWMA